MTCDELHRVVIPEAIPGQQYVVEGLTLAPVPAKRRRKSRAEVMAAIRASKLKFRGSWDEIRAETREP